MNDRSYGTLFRIVGLPIALSAMAVALGLLKPLLGFLAAVGLVIQRSLGHWFGRIVWAWVHGGRRGMLFWSAFSIFVGVCSGIGIASIWGVVGGIPFGVVLTMLLVGIGYPESKQQQRKA